MKFIVTFTCLFATLCALPAFAQEEEGVPEAAYREYIVVEAIDVAVPTVVELPLSNGYFGSNVLVKEIDTERYIGSTVQQEMVRSDVHVQARSVPPLPNIEQLVDQDASSYVQFEVADELMYNVAEIELETDAPITTSEIDVHLAPHVALPQSVSLRVREGGVFKTIIAETHMQASAVTFPEVTADSFVLTFSYSQPLRLEEVVIKNAEAPAFEQFLRFLAQPGATYVVYVNSDQDVYVETTEAGDLSSEVGVLRLPAAAPVANPAYVPADVDGDDVIDQYDNCVSTYNPGQEDIDGNGRGDACDDFDRDGVMNQLDTCLTVPNRNQVDTDGDGVGDACDTEESRFTERNAWVPWAGIGTAALVLLTLFGLVATTRRPEEDAAAGEQGRASE